MGGDFSKFNKDRKFPVKVVPVATFFDVIEKKHKHEIEHAKSEVYRLVKDAFNDADADVENPIMTSCKEGSSFGHDELRGMVRTALLEQIRSDEFSQIWRRAFASSVSACTQKHYQKFPDVDAEWRLFDAAYKVTASTSDKIPLFDLKPSADNRPPWWLISEIPDASAAFSIRTAKACISDASRPYRTWTFIFKALIISCSCMAAVCWLGAWYVELTTAPIQEKLKNATSTNEALQAELSSAEAQSTACRREVKELREQHAIRSLRLLVLEAELDRFRALDNKNLTDEAHMAGKLLRKEESKIKNLTDEAHMAGKLLRKKESKIKNLTDEAHMTGKLLRMKDSTIKNLTDECWCWC